MMINTTLDKRRRINVPAKLRNQFSDGFVIVKLKTKSFPFLKIISLSEWQEYLDKLEKYVAELKNQFHKYHNCETKKRVDMLYEILLYSAPRHAPPRHTLPRYSLPIL